MRGSRTSAPSCYSERFNAFLSSNMEDVRGALQEQIEKVKENINDVDKNISKLYGRDPNEPR